MIVYVMRDGNGKIVGVFYGDQPGFNLEPMPIDDPEVDAFLHPVPAFYQISKMTPWLRMTDAEAVAVRATMEAEATVRLQEIYRAAPYLQSNDDLWPTMVSILTSALSPERAEELLAPETP